MMMSQCGMSNGECGGKPAKRKPARIPHSPSPIPHSAFPSGVTLIELLITMAIMAIISAAILGTASAAMESARRSRTQQLITKIHGLVLERLATYETRRLEIRPEITGAIDIWVQSTPMSSPPTPAEMRELARRNAARGQMLADARLLAVREAMKMEMPDMIEDISHTPLVLASRPSLSAGYFRRYTAAQGDLHDSAECLYMTVMGGTGDGEARTLFAKQDIGDTDDDGAPEFLDGWGEPIKWIRWAPGLVSDLQAMDASGNRPSDPLDPWRRDRQAAPGKDLMPPIGDYPQVPTTSPGKPFQLVYRTNIRDRLTAAGDPPFKSAFRLVPLIYSVGPDGESAYLVIPDEQRRDRPLDPFHIANSNDLGPYQVGRDDPQQRNANKDNITNHLVEY
jgi:prepilin-type N-terminal cleavage/methylation domain-containing protein